MHLFSFSFNTDFLILASPSLNGDAFEFICFSPRGLGGKAPKCFTGMDINPHTCKALNNSQNHIKPKPNIQK